MRPIRNCYKADFNSGKSGCPIDYGKIKGAIIVPAGEKLPAGFDGDDLREACHADLPNRIYPVLLFVEYAKNGGEPQVSAVGYGPNKVTGIKRRHGRAGRHSNELHLLDHHPSSHFGC